MQFNQPQKDAFAMLVQMQTPLGAFPQTAEAIHLQPENATRFAGTFRIVNDGAVRLEVLSGQRTVANFAGPISRRRTCFTPRAASVLPIVSPARISRCASRPTRFCRKSAFREVLAYNLGESELAVDAEIELDIREAPLRELLLNIPKGYAVAKLTASGLSDYFTSETPDHTGAELRLVYGQPISDRQVVAAAARTQSIAGRNELDAAAHRSGAGEIRARLRGRVRGQRFPAHGRAHAGVDGNRHGVFPQATAPASSRPSA